MCLAAMDESGDPGMKLGKGSSRLFTIGLLLFQEEAQAEACRGRIQALRKALGMKLSGKNAEFHFSKLGADFREAFLVAVANDPFQFFSCTIDKARLSGRAWNKKEYLVHRAGVLTLDLAAPQMREAKLLFDATSSRKFDWEFLRMLRKHAGYRDQVPVIKETQRLESYKDDLVQMIDMVCGAMLSEEKRYTRHIAQRVAGSVIYPPLE